MRSPKATKSAKTRAKKQPAKIDPATEKRSQAYRDIEPHRGRREDGNDRGPAFRRSQPRAL
jgi:hypothetical protein